MSSYVKQKSEQDKSQQNVKPAAGNQGLVTCGTTKKVPFKYHVSSHNQSNVTTVTDRNAQKLKATYSAQHQAPYVPYQQNFKTNSPSALNFPNAGVASYPCNAAPLYVSSHAMNNEQNIPMQNAAHNNTMQYSCPCCNVPPPIPPCKDDLWDLQFCRWWGWNWIRKREEMMNQKRADVKTKSTGTKPPANEKGKRNNRRRRHKQDDFFSWCNKLFKGPRKQKQELKAEEKKQLQELYDTPCSSITFNNCPCPMDDWGSRSLNLEGQYECYCGSTRQTSMSTVVVENKTRRQRCKQNVRKHQSWVYEKTESSSSDEFCPCVCACKQRGKSSTGESVEYLSMRMANIKSDCEDNLKCPCMKLKQKENEENSSKSICCPCKEQKNQGKRICCPCMIKLVYEKQNNSTHSRFPQEKEKCIKCNCSVPQKNNLPKHRHPSPSRSLPVCRPQPPKVPRLRTHSPLCHPQPLSKNHPEFRKRPKRKNLDCCCQIKKECMLYCPCEDQPMKKKRKSEKPKKIYCCYCCCCCKCCCACNNKAEPALNVKESVKKTSDKCVDTMSMVENRNVMNPNTSSYNNNQPRFCGVGPQRNGAEFYGCFPMGDCIQDYVCNTRQFTVSKAFEKGSYASPLTGRLYNLNPEFFTANEVSPQNDSLKPIDLSEKIFNINPVESPVADEEHKILLTAVCEAIMSSRISNTSSSHQTHTHPKAQLLLNNNRRHGLNPRRTNHARPTNVYEHVENYNQQFLPHSSDEVDDYGSDKAQNCNPDALPNFGISETFEYTTLQKQKSVSNMSEKNQYFITTGKHGPIRRRYQKKPAESQRLQNLNVIHSERMLTSLNLPLLQQKYSVESLSPNISLKGFRNEHETSNRKTASLNPSLQNFYIQNFTSPSNPLTIQKSRTEISVDDSAETPNSEGVSSSLNSNLTKSHGDLSESLIPFNSPRTWISPPQLPGISVTGLFSTVGHMKEFAKDSKYHKKNFNKNMCNNIDIEQFKKQRLYDVLFPDDHSAYPENFSNLPYNYRPIPNPSSPARNPATYPSLVLRELSSDGAQATQTSATKTPATKKYSCKEMQCQCTEDECKTQSEEGSTQLPRATSSKATETANVWQSKSAQPGSSKTTDTNDVVPRSAKASTTSKVVPSKLPQASYSKLAQTKNLSRSKSAHPASSKPTEIGETTSKSPRAGSSKAIATRYIQPKSPRASSSKLIQTSNMSYKPSNIVDAKSTNISDIQFNSSNTIKACDMNCCTNLKMADSKSTETSDHRHVKQDLAGISFQMEKNPETEIGCTYFDTVDFKDPEKEMSCTYFNEVDSKVFHSPFASLKDSEKEMGYRHINEVDSKDIRRTFASFKNSEREISCSYFTEDSKHLFPHFTNVALTTHPFEGVGSQTSDETCVYAKHQPQDFNYLTTDVKSGKSEQLLSVVDIISEESLSDLPFVTKNLVLQDGASTSKCTDCRPLLGVKNENQNLLPEPFVPANQTPVYVNTVTSPFKIRYAKTRSRDISLPENFVKKKMPKRESPFSMFCAPVAPRNIDANRSANYETAETGSLSRPDRQVVLAKPKKLKERQKRWRY